MSCHKHIIFFTVFSKLWWRYSNPDCKLPVWTGPSDSRCCLLERTKTSAHPALHRGELYTGDWLAYWRLGTGEYDTHFPRGLIQFLSRPCFLFHILTKTHLHPYHICWSPGIMKITTRRRSPTWIAPRTKLGHGHSIVILINCFLGQDGDTHMILSSGNETVKCLSCNCL